MAKKSLSIFHSPWFDFAHHKPSILIFSAPSCRGGELKRRRVPLKRQARCRGFLLMEAMLASVILAVAVIGVAGVLATSYGQTKAMRENAIAVGLGHQLLEEIAALPLGNTDGSEATGPLAGHANRAEFQIAGEYNGYSDDTNSMTMLGGGTISPGDGELYSRKVTVTYESSPSGPVTSSGDFALVTVSVTTPSNQVVTLSRLLTVTSWAI